MGIIRCRSNFGLAFPEQSVKASMLKIEHTTPPKWGVAIFEFHGRCFICKKLRQPIEIIFLYGFCQFWRKPFPQFWGKTPNWKKLYAASKREARECNAKLLILFARQALRQARQRYPKLLKMLAARSGKEDHSKEWLRACRDAAY